MRKAVVLLCSIAALSACQTDERFIVFKPGASDAQTQASIDQCRIASFREIPQTMATTITPGVSTPGTVQCNTYGTMTSCQSVGGLNIPARAETYDVNADLRDRYIAQCLRGKGFDVSVSRSCSGEAEQSSAMKAKREGRKPNCITR